MLANKGFTCKPSKLTCCLLVLWKPWCTILLRRSLLLSALGQEAHHRKWRHGSNRYLLLWPSHWWSRWLVHRICKKVIHFTASDKREMGKSNWTTTAAIARTLPTDRRDLGLTPDPDVTRWLTSSLILVLTFKDSPPPPPFHPEGWKLTYFLQPKREVWWDTRNQ